MRVLEAGGGGYRASVWGDERTLEMDSGGWLHNIFIVINAMNCILKIVKMAKFVL